MPTTPSPANPRGLHWNDVFDKATGRYNVAAIVGIARLHARKDFNRLPGGNYARIFAQALRTVWQVARGYQASWAWSRA